MSVNFKGLEITPLTRDSYVKYIKEITNFNSGNPAIDMYFRNDAYYERINFTESTSLVLREGKLVGYFALTAGEIEFPEVTEKSLEVAMLATDIELQGGGIGIKMIEYIEHLAMATCIRYITLDAVNGKLTWYQNRGFKHVSIEEIEEGSPFYFMFKDLHNEVWVNEYMEKRGDFSDIR
ncbi:GNAT family N-acetyltransferase [Bacillus cereus]|uniref:GNAT family N-acetyltransferase n=1 Tax=Bacillus cereus TaxID=1396 RepID=UPI00363E6691